MTATDEMCRLLDECGVKWTSERVSNGVLFTFTKDGHTYSVFVRDRAGLEIWSQYLTPAQAIAATLGQDQRNCHNISDFNPVDVFTCSECGSSFKVRQFKIDADGVLDDETEFEFVPMHCPWCGAKVVDE